MLSVLVGSEIPIDVVSVDLIFQQAQQALYCVIALGLFSTVRI